MSPDIGNEYNHRTANPSVRNGCICSWKSAANLDLKFETHIGGDDIGDHGLALRG